MEGLRSARDGADGVGGARDDESGCGTRPPSRHSRVGGNPVEKPWPRSGHPTPGDTAFSIRWQRADFLSRLYLLHFLPRIGIIDGLDLYVRYGNHKPAHLSRRQSCQQIMLIAAGNKHLSDEHDLLWASLLWAYSRIITR